MANIKKAVKMVFPLLLILILMSGLSVRAADAPTPLMLFNFDANWEYMFTGDNGSAYELGYSNSENALTVTSDADGNPYTYVDLALDESKQFAYPGAKMWMVVCAKATLSASQSSKSGTFQTYIANIPDANQWNYINLTGISSDYQTFVSACIDPNWQPSTPLQAGDVFNNLRFVPGGIPDADGGTVLYVKYVAFFADQADAQAFAGANPDNANLTANVAPTSPTLAITTAPPTTAVPSASVTSATVASTAANTSAGPNVGLIIGIIAAVIVVIVIVIIIVVTVSKKGKKSGGGDEDKKA